MDEVSEWVKAGWYLGICPGEHPLGAAIYATRNPTELDSWAAGHLKEYPGHQIERARGKGTP